MAGVGGGVVWVRGEASLFLSGLLGRVRWGDIGEMWCCHWYTTITTWMSECVVINEGDNGNGGSGGGNGDAPPIIYIYSCLICTRRPVLMA